jgi:hypothetical protein
MVLNISQSYRPLRPVTGITLFTLFIYVDNKNPNSYEGLYTTFRVFYQKLGSIAIISELTFEDINSLGLGQKLFMVL